MSKTFRSYQPEQRLLLPPSLEEWLPEGHLARFVSDVVEELDLGEIYAAYEDDGRGLAAYHPLLMVRLLFYGYCVGKASSRKLEQASYEDVAVRYLAANQHPDHDSIAAFRRRHLGALARLFGQVLQMCQKAGLVKLRHVAIDGTKIRANASRYRGLTYERMEEEQRKLEEEIAGWLEHAEEVDRAEDEEYGKGCRGDELPPEWRTREKRLAKIRALKAELEREAREAAEKKKAEAERRLAERRAEEERRGRRFGGRVPRVPDVEQARPKPHVQRNLTDPESRIMKDGATNSFQQCYNAQVAVDGACQVIVAARVTQAEHDREQLVPNLQEVERQVGRKVEEASADCGYYDPDHLRSEYLNDVRLYLPPVPEPRKPPGSKASRWARNGPLLDRLREQRNQPEAQAIYQLRQSIVEPVFGQIKQWRGFRQFWLRGLRAVRAEWQIICATHNLLKLYRFGGEIST
jgi:transposase